MDAFCHEHEREEHEGIRSLGVTIQMSRKLWTRGTWREAEHRSSVHPHHPHPALPRVLVVICLFFFSYFQSLGSADRKENQHKK